MLPPPPPAMLDDVSDVRPPSSSVSPPSADRLVSADRAAGLERSCAKGMAAAREEAGTLVEAGFEVLLDDAVVALLDEATLPFAVAVEFVRANAADPDALAPDSWARLAFCSSTL